MYNHEQLEKILKDAIFMAIANSATAINISQISLLTGLNRHQVAEIVEKLSQERRIFTRKILNSKFCVVMKENSEVKNEMIKYTNPILARNIH